MEKIDLRKQYKQLYQPTAKKVELVQVPRLRFAMLDGVIPAGEKPGENVKFQEAMTALYGIAYTLKFMFKLRKNDPIDFTVMALEGLWWVKDGEFDFITPMDMYYTVMIMQPDFVTEELFQEGVRQLRKKKDNPAAAQLRLEDFEEGLSVQMLHIGPYATEMETINKMKQFTHENKLARNGHHHEIYLGDPRRAAPEALKTVLRQAVAPEIVV